jgi:3-dehydroquinate synthase
MTTRLRVPTDRPYDVVIGNGVHEELRGLVGVGLGVMRVAIIHPPSMRERAQVLRESLLADALEVHLIEVPDGERAKTADVLAFCWKILGESGFTRSDVVVGLGGGATTDLAGFVAASWLRGVRFVNVPTTVLGMVDAAVGGKTGMNTGAGKNLVGSFHEPAGVICDLDVLTTLPRAELVAGLGEVVKCGFIADPQILTLVEADPAAARDPRSARLRELVERAVRVKIDVVVDDLEERGGSDGHPGREALNYGHTLAHAVEKGTGYRVRHGEAVALGMVFAAELARLAGRLDDETALRHAPVLESVGLPTRLADVGVSDLAFEQVLATMRVDKKARGAHLRFLVLEGVARPAILSDPEEHVLRAAYDLVRGVSR